MSISAIKFLNSFEYPDDAGNGWYAPLVIFSINAGIDSASNGCFCMHREYTSTPRLQISALVVYCLPSTSSGARE